MNRQTLIIVVSPAPECWGNFKKLCEAKGWKYQQLANAGKVPKIGQPVEIDGLIVHRVKFQ